MSIIDQGCGPVNGWVIIRCMLKYSEPVPVSDEERQELLEFAVEAAVGAGERTLPFFRSEVVTENKREDGGFDPVTEADKAAERELRERIRIRYPEHGVYGEEFGLQPGNGLTWVIDPIDGTRAFMSGMLHWGLLLAAFDGQRPIVGVMYQPYTEEIWCGDGRTARFRRGSDVREMRVSGCRDLSDAVLTTTSPGWFEAGDRPRFDRLEREVKMCRYGGDCYIYAMLAMGTVDLATDGSLNPYDIQALIPIIEGAGGMISTYDGGDACMGGTVIAAASPELHAAALAAFQMVDP
jgi:myo-inositol-1(or 4)-monophosphatase